MELQFGKNTWATDNLSIINFLNGDKIPFAKSKKEWKKLCDNKLPACAYLNFKDKITKEGVYYNIFSIVDQRGIIPKGWKIPTTKDWDSLARAIGGKKNAGEAMKSTKGWVSYKSTEAGSSKFAALPSGKIGTSIDDPDFSSIGSLAYWWTKDIENSFPLSRTKEIENNRFVTTYVSQYGTELLRSSIFSDDYNNEAYLGMNVRCVKDL